MQTLDKALLPGSGRLFFKPLKKKVERLSLFIHAHFVPFRDILSISNSSNNSPYIERHPQQPEGTGKVFDITLRNC